MERYLTFASASSIELISDLRRSALKLDSLSKYLLSKPDKLKTSSIGLSYVVCIWLFHLRSKG